MGAGGTERLVPMKQRLCLIVTFVAFLPMAKVVFATPPGQYRLTLRPEQVTSSSPHADFSGLVDEQLEAGDPPASEPATGWKISSQHNREFPFQATVDLGK